MAPWYRLKAGSLLDDNQDFIPEKLSNQRITPFLRVIIKQIGIQSPASQEFSPHIERNRLDFNFTCGEIDIGYLPI
jgi:hypothetical protein